MSSPVAPSATARLVLAAAAALVIAIVLLALAVQMTAHPPT